jgi:glucose/arabinose dehydrogenase
MRRLCLLIFFALWMTALHAQSIEITLKPFITKGLARPLYLTHGGDGSGRVYIVEQAGRIRVAESDGTLQDELFLDIVSLVDSGGERGLLGVAFHPDFAENGLFFVNYTDLNGDTNIVRYHAPDPYTADPDSAATILFIDQPAGNHNGGLLKFGRDGYLYIGMGDGGGGNSQNGQRPDTLLGKMLRLDVDQTSGDKLYAIPPDNPFVDDAEFLPEIWVYGLRNPWRWSFDRLNGDLYIGDVGSALFEEISYQRGDSAGGENYGWPAMEGTTCRQEDACEDMVLSIVAYGRGEGVCVVTGGYVYRGEQYPALQGTYLFGDYCTGQIWGFPAEQAASETVNYEELLDTDLRIASFGEDEAGELYVVSLSGSVYRITLSE